MLGIVVPRRNELIVSLTRDLSSFTDRMSERTARINNELDEFVTTLVDTTVRSTNRNFLIPNVLTVFSRSTNSARPRFGSSHSAADHTGKFSGHVAGVGLRGDRDRKRYGTSFPGKAEPGTNGKKE